MIRLALLLTAVVSLFSSCRSTRKIQTAVAAKDTTAIVVIPPSDNPHEDSLKFISSTYKSIQKNHIAFTAFTAKIDVDYQDADEKKYNVTAHIRMQKDSLIWILISGPLGIEGLRAYITPDSVKMIDKQNHTYTARSVAYLQDVTALPLNLSSLQDLFLGNPVFSDSNIISYNQSDDAITLLNIGSFFKNLITIGKTDYLIRASKLDDLDVLRNRTCYLTYSDYDTRRGVNFPTTRHITVTEKKKLDIKLNFKQYDFSNETLSFPFSVPKSYKQN